MDRDACWLARNPQAIQRLLETAAPRIPCPLVPKMDDVLQGYLLSWNQQSAEPLLTREQHFWQDKAGKAIKLKGSGDGLLRIITGAWL